MTDSEIAALRNGTKPAKQDLTITIKATLDGFPVEIVYTGSIDQLLATTKRLRELGAEPSQGTSSIGTLPARKPAAERVEPLYKPDGTACCPVHQKPLVEGRYGLYCPAKAREGDAQNDKGYCSLRFAE